MPRSTASSIKTIRRWRREYQRRGRPRGQAHTAVACPRCDGARLDDAAYAELLGWYLGDGHITRDRKRRLQPAHLQRCPVRPATSIEIVELHAARQARRTTSSTCAARLRHRDLRMEALAVLVSAAWARAQARAADRAEPWQQEIVDAHPEALLRGLFHSDGCRVTNWTVRPAKAGPKRYEYPRYMFSNESADIIGICTAALDQIGVHWTMPRRNLLSVARATTSPGSTRSSVRRRSR